ncbi:MAG TPA: hypothetical protein VGI40_14900 [Pirellulaceae bacterium]|jgi:hypothetical protein
MVRCILRPTSRYSRPSRRLALLSLPLLALIVGCSEPNPLGRRPIQGQITLNGKPVDYGSIQFSPEDPDHGVSSGAMIENGRYHTKVTDGLPPGSYKVMITSPDRGKVEKVEGPPGDERSFAVERIPKKYNLQSTLKIEVPKGRGPHTADFALD